MTLSVVSSGQTSSVFVTSGNILYVLSGGEIVDTQVQGDGEVVLTSGGIGNNTLISGAAGSAALGYIQAGGIEDGGQVVSAGTLTVQGGGVDSGTVAGPGGIIDVTLDGLAENTTINTGALVVSSGGSAVSATATGVVGSQGAIFVSSGGAITAATISTDGVDYVFAGASALNTIVNSSGVEVLSGGAATGSVLLGGSLQEVLTGGVASGTVVNSGALLFVSGGTITDTTLVSGGTIDIRTLGYGGVTSALLDPATDVLTVTEGGTTETLQLAGSYTGENFLLSSDANGGTSISVECFLAGTAIQTDRGEVVVESLRPGDIVVTLFGGPMKIRAVERRSYEAPSGVLSPQVCPVRIAAGALAENIPNRDLYVSPDHAMYLDDVLVPASLLINGDTITQPWRNETVDYYHVEVDPHDILFANGAACESYLDIGKGTVFYDPRGAEHLASPEPKTWEDACAPLVLTGSLLDKIRNRLSSRIPHTVNAPMSIVRAA